jgi:WD40 repeat protein
LTPYHLAFAPEGRTAAAIDWPRTVKVWSLETLQERASLTIDKGYLSKVAYTADGTTLLTGGVQYVGRRTDLEVRRWNLATQQQVGCERCRTQHAASSFSMVPGDPVLLAGGCYLGQVTVGSPGKRSVKVALPEHRAFAQVCFSPDGRTLAILRERTVRLWDVATRQVRASWKENRTINALAFSPSSRTLATGGNDGAVKFRDVATGKEGASFDWQLGAISAVAFSPDGMLAAAGGQDGRVVIWDVDQV